MRRGNWIWRRQGRGQLTANNLSVALIGGSLDTWSAMVNSERNGAPEDSADFICLLTDEPYSCIDQQFKLVNSTRFKIIQCPRPCCWASDVGIVGARC
jgi:hypothetical protein